MIPSIIGIYEAQVCLNINRMPLKIALAKRIIIKTFRYSGSFVKGIVLLIPFAQFYS